MSEGKDEIKGREGVNDDAGSEKQGDGTVAIPRFHIPQWVRRLIGGGAVIVGGGLAMGAFEGDETVWSHTPQTIERAPYVVPSMDMALVAVAQNGDSDIFCSDRSGSDWGNLTPAITSGQGELLNTLANERGGLFCTNTDCTSQTVIFISDRHGSDDIWQADVVNASNCEFANIQKWNWSESLGLTSEDYITMFEGQLFMISNNDVYNPTYNSNTQQWERGNPLAAINGNLPAVIASITFFRDGNNDVWMLFSTDDSAYNHQSGNTTDLDLVAVKIDLANWVVDMNTWVNANNMPDTDNDINTAGDETSAHVDETGALTWTTGTVGVDMWTRRKSPHGSTSGGGNAQGGMGQGGEGEGGMAGGTAGGTPESPKHQLVSGNCTVERVDGKDVFAGPVGELCEFERVPDDAQDDRECGFEMTVLEQSGGVTVTIDSNGNIVSPKRVYFHGMEEGGCYITHNAAGVPLTIIGTDWEIGWNEEDVNDPMMGVDLLEGTLQWNGYKIVYFPEEVCSVRTENGGVEIQPCQETWQPASTELFIDVDSFEFPEGQFPPINTPPDPEEPGGCHCSTVGLGTESPASPWWLLGLLGGAGAVAQRRREQEVSESGFQKGGDAVSEGDGMYYNLEAALADEDFEDPWIDDDANLDEVA